MTIATNMAGRGTDIILGGNAEYMAWNELRHTYATRLDVPVDFLCYTPEEFDALRIRPTIAREAAEHGVVVA